MRGDSEPIQLSLIEDKKWSQLHFFLKSGLLTLSVFWEMLYVDKKIKNSQICQAQAHILDFQKSFDVWEKFVDWYCTKLGFHFQN